MKTTNSEELDFQWYGVKVLYKYLIADKPKEESLANILSRHYPEVMENKTEQIRKNFLLRNRDFN
ncbi:hypothetical protein ACFW1J_10090 [Priestia aryabhattai]|uniref:hypothetical protein n=1 Tax=Priestia aryabhattai TaxID=412384 RepID=UPI001C8DF453|nr:hypothetical protein [Priestia aryabhattai]MBX9968101.1 hypothetical protein [Priestia aryabhattai]